MARTSLNVRLLTYTCLLYTSSDPCEAPIAAIDLNQIDFGDPVENELEDLRARVSMLEQALAQILCEKEPNQ